MQKLPRTMRGIWLTGHGGLDKLELRDDIPLPRLGGRDVLIKVAAAGVNNTDINTRIGWYSKNDGADDDASWTGEALQLPRIQGADVCGRIVAVGQEVSKERIGERVIIEPSLRERNGQQLERHHYFGSECDGGFAEYAVAPARHAHRIESPLSDIELASFPCSYSTAENMLTRASVGAGDRVLITGASGGVGSAAIQLAKARGAEVVAVTSPSKAKTLKDLGAARTLGRHDGILATLGRNSVDVVVDLVAGAQWPEFLEVLRPGGRYAVAGAIGGPIVALDVRTLYLKDLSLYGCTMLEEGVFANLVSHIEQGRIAPLVSATYPLERIADAQTAFETKAHIGKIVLTISPEN